MEILEKQRRELSDREQQIKRENGKINEREKQLAENQKIVMEILADRKTTLLFQLINFYV